MRPAEALHSPRPLVERGELRAEVRGEALISGHLFKASGDLAHGLGPSRGRVGLQHDLVTHVTEVLGHRDTRVDARFAGGHRHVGSVGHQHGTLHQRLARVRVGELGELHEYVGHLVATLAATDEDDHLRVTPLGHLMLRDRLAGAERAGDARDAAFDEREERVDHARTGDERLARADLARVRTRHAHRPRLHEGEIVQLAGVVAQLRHRVGHRVRSARDLHDLTGERRRHHDAVLDHHVLLHRADDVTAAHTRTRGECGYELPPLLAVETRRRDAAREEGARFRLERIKRALHTVVDRLEHPGAELHRQRRTRRYDGHAGAEALGLLVYLYRGAIAPHLDDLAHEALFAHADQVVHPGVRQADRHNEGPCDFPDRAVVHLAFLFS